MKSSENSVRSVTSSFSSGLSSSAFLITNSLSSQ